MPAPVAVYFSPFSPQVYVQFGEGQPPQLVVDAQATYPGLASGPICEPKLSPDERLLAFVRGQEVHVLRLLQDDVPLPGQPPSLQHSSEWPAADRPQDTPAPQGSSQQHALTPPAANVDTHSARASPQPTASPSWQPRTLPHGGPPWQMATRCQRPEYVTCAARRSRSLAEFVEKEALDNFEGYWWSADSKWIAFQVCANQAL